MFSRASRELEPGSSRSQVGSHRAQSNDVELGFPVELYEQVSESVAVYTRDARYVYVNPVTEKLVGKKLEELRGRSLWDVFPDAVGEPYHRAFERVASSGRPERFEHLYSPWNKWFEQRLYLAGGQLWAIGTDITERKDVEDRMFLGDARRAREQLQLIIDAVPVLISYVDAQGHYRLNNLTYEKWFGRSREELYGKHLREVVGEAAFEAVRPDVERALSGVPVTYERQMPYVSAGSRWVQGTCIPDIDGAGAVRGMVVLVQDIGERKQHEEQLRERSEFERHVLGIVSHDLRNPISVMMMSAATLLMRGEADTNIASGLRRIVASGERATRMIRDLLDFTQARVMGGIPLERRPFDFHVHVRQGTEELRAAHPDREILIAASGDGQGAWDPDRVTQLLVNLVGNAVAYSPETTPVQVRTCGEEQSLLVEVHNRGAPIPAETMQGLFEPFKRGKEHRESTSRSVGLGLYIVKQLVLAHGGTIDVTSTEAEGTTFSVRLPRDAEALSR